MKKKYTDYNATDFSSDDAFIRWILCPNEEDELFWNGFIVSHPEKAEDIEVAINILKGIRLNHFRFTSAEKDAMSDNIAQRVDAYNYKKKLRIGLIAIVAACLIGIIWFTVPSVDPNSKTSITQTTDGDPSDSLSGNDIQLILGNNQTVNFNQNVDIRYNQSGQVVVSNKNKEIQSIDVDNGTVQWNKLIVPRGKHSFITLPDKSKIWINSGSILEFPTSFANNKRQIKVDGEIYIEVQKDTERPFFVSLKSFEVKVLGTRFNISAYKEEPKQYIVLVEGSVDVISQSGKSYRLKPDQLLSVQEGQYSLESNVDVYDYISWKDGLLQFKGQPLTVILNQLSRYYDIPIECEPALGNVKCQGKLILFEKIDSVLQTVSDIVPIEWEMRNRVLVINKKK